MNLALIPIIILLYDMFSSSLFCATKCRMSKCKSLGKCLMEAKMLASNVDGVAISWWNMYQTPETEDLWASKRKKLSFSCFVPVFFYDFHSLKHSVFDAFSLSFALLFICAHHCVANTIQNDSIFFDGTIWFVKIVESIPHCSIVCAMASSLENWWCWNCHQIIYHLAIIASLWMIINELNFW